MSSELKTGGLEIVAWRWFSGGTGTVGIVHCFDPFEGPRYFIGATLTGINEETDAVHIAQWGAAFPPDAGKLLFGA